MLISSGSDGRFAVYSSTDGLDWNRVLLQMPASGAGRTLPEGAVALPTDPDTVPPSGIPSHQIVPSIPSGTTPGGRYSLFSSFRAAMFKGKITIITQLFSTSQKVSGHTDPVDPDVFNARVFTSLDGAVWSEVPIDPAKTMRAKLSSSMFVHNNKLYIMAGFDSNIRTYTRDLYEFDYTNPEGTTGGFTKITDASGIADVIYSTPAAHGGASSGIIQNGAKIYTTGRFTDGNVLLSSENGINWTNEPQSQDKPFSTEKVGGVGALQGQPFVHSDKFYVSHVFHKERLVPKGSFFNGSLISITATKFQKDSYLHLFSSSPLSTPVKLDTTWKPDPAGTLDGYEWERIETNIPPMLNFGMFILNDKIHLLGGDRDFRSGKVSIDPTVVWISDGTVSSGTVSQGQVGTAKPTRIEADLGLGAGKQTYNNVPTITKTTEAASKMEFTETKLSAPLPAWVVYAPRLLFFDTKAK